MIESLKTKDGQEKFENFTYFVTRRRCQKVEFLGLLLNGTTQSRSADEKKIGYGSSSCAGRHTLSMRKFVHDTTKDKTGRCRFGISRQRKRIIVVCPKVRGEFGLAVFALFCLSNRLLRKDYNRVGLGRSRSYFWPLENIQGVLISFWSIFVSSILVHSIERKCRRVERSTVTSCSHHHQCLPIWTINFLAASVHCQEEALAFLKRLELTRSSTFLERNLTLPFWNCALRRRWLWATSTLTTRISPDQACLSSQNG